MPPPTADENRGALRVLVADDHPVVRAGLVAMITAAPGMSVVFEASDGREALQGWKTRRPDLGLIDLLMPDLDGFEALSGIRRMEPAARLVVLTMACSEEEVHRALQLGAGGFLLKDCGAPELLTCLRAVARGQKYLQAEAAGRLAQRVTHSELTGRESAVLAWLVQGLSNKQIARHLAVSEATVKTHVRHLLGKLDAISRTQAVRIALQRGLVPLQWPADPG
jgi:two-component system NarL family response regulator